MIFFFFFELYYCLDDIRAHENKYRKKSTNNLKKLKK